MSTVVTTFAELEHELAKRGAVMMARVEPGKDRHRVLVTMRASAVDALKSTKPIEVMFVGESLVAATAGAFAKLDFMVVKITRSGATAT